MWFQWNRVRFVLLGAIIAASVGGCVSDLHLGCAQDSDCDPGRLCVERQCRAPAAGDATAAVDAGDATQLDGTLRPPKDGTSPGDVGNLPRDATAPPADVAPPPPDETVPPPDVGPMDATDEAGRDAAPDTGRPDASPEAGPGDAAPDASRPDAAPDAGPPLTPCGVQDGGPAPGVDPTLQSLVDDPPVPVGGPPFVEGSYEPFLLENVDGDRAGTPEFVTLRGGRVQARSADNRLLWQGPVFQALSIAGTVDFNGDGRPELVVRGALDVHIYDLPTGTLRWSVPDHPLGPNGLAQMRGSRLLIDDIDGDGLPDLQLSDGGCGSAGTGTSVFFSFAGLVADADGRWGLGTVLGAVNGPNACADLTTHADLDGDGLPELIAPTAAGITVFNPLPFDPAVVDPAALRPRYCTDQVPGARAVSVANLDSEADGAPTPEIVVATASEVFVLEVSDQPATGACPAAANGDLPVLGLNIRWHAPLPGLRPTSLVVFGGPGEGRVAASAYAADLGAWHSEVWSGHDDGSGGPATLHSEAGAVLLGRAELDGDVSTTEFIAYRGMGATLSAFGELHGLNWSDADTSFAELWSRPSSTPLAGRHQASDASKTSNLPSPLAISGQAVTVVHDAATGEVIQLAAVAADGTARTRTWSGEPGAADADCSGPCRLGIGRYDGTLALLDPLAESIPLLNAAADGTTPRASAPTGASELVLAEDAAGVPVPVVVTQTGVLARVEMGAPPARLGRQHGLGVDPNLSHNVPSTTVVLAAREGQPTLVARRDFRVTDWIAWSAYDITHLNDPGDDTPAWASSDGFPTPTYVGLGLAVALDCDGDGQDDLVRMDGGPSPGMCPPPRANRATTGDRIVTAIRGTTGAQLWQHAISPGSPCIGAPSKEQLSVVTIDGVKALFLTETSTLRRLDPADGAELARADIDGFGGNTIRSGGAIIATGLSAPDPAILRAGGNGPLDAWTVPSAGDTQISLAWRAAVDGQPQAWTGRQALTIPASDPLSGPSVWVSPGNGRPLSVYRIAGQEAAGVERQPVGTIGLFGGALADGSAGMLNFATMQVVQQPTPGAPEGVLVTGNDSFLYFLDFDGNLLFRREYAAAVGRPQVVDLDGDGVQEMLVPVGDGSLVPARLPGLPPVGDAWDIPCPALPLCEPEHDLTTTADRHRLCAEWTPVARAEGYETRVVGLNGTEIQPWLHSPPDSWATDDNLELTPGLDYHVQVRAFRARGRGVLEYSPPLNTDGVRVIDESAPTAHISVDEDVLSAGDPPVPIRLTVQDAEGLASWRVELRGTDRPSSLLSGGPAAGTDPWDVRVEFSGRGHDGARLPEGCYTLVGIAQDLAGAETAASTPMRVGARGLEPCP